MLKMNLLQKALLLVGLGVVSLATARPAQAANTSATWSCSVCMDDCQYHWQLCQTYCGGSDWITTCEPVDESCLGTDKTYYPFETLCRKNG